MEIAEHSVKKKYASKLLSQIIGGSITALTTLLIPKYLGASQYGSFSYITNFFQTIVYMINNSPLNVLCVDLAKKDSEKKQIILYVLFFSFAISVLAIGIGLMFGLNLSHILWPHVSIKLVYLGVLYTFFSMLFVIFIQICDALGLTLKNEFLKITQKIIFFIFILLAIKTQHTLTLPHFFIANYLSYILYLYFVTKILFKTNILTRNSFNSLPIKTFTHTLLHKSKALISSDVLGALSGLYTFWLLQKYSGPIEMAYYAIGMQLGAILSSIPLAFMPLLNREFSKKEFILEEKQNLYALYYPLIFASTAFFAIFVFYNANAIIQFLGKTDYQNGLFTIKIYIFGIALSASNTIHYGYLLTQQKNKFLFKLTLEVVLTGLVVMSLCLLPTSYYGLGLGSKSLAIWFVVSTLYGNIRMGITCRKDLKLSQKIFFKKEIKLITLLLVTGLLSSTLTNAIQPLLFKVACSLILFLGLNTVIIYNYSEALLGLKKEKIKQLTQNILKKAQEKFDNKN